jgi:hypothetical protein
MVDTVNYLKARVAMPLIAPLVMLLQVTEYFIWFPLKIRTCLQTHGNTLQRAVTFLD